MPCFSVFRCRLLARILVRGLLDIRGSGGRRVGLVLSPRLLGSFSGTAALAVAALLDAAGAVGVAFASVSGAPPARRTGPAVVALVALVAPSARDDRLRAALTRLLAGLLTALLRVLVLGRLLRLGRSLGMLVVLLVA